MPYTIDKLDISLYNMYAVRITMIEQINTQLRLGEASTIPPQTQLVDLFPKLTELDILLGVIPVTTPWAFFFPPQRYQRVRRNPFAFFRVAPSFGTLEEQAKEEARLEQFPCETEEQEKQKAVLLKCFKQMNKINEMLSYIIGRIGQFILG